MSEDTLWACTIEATLADDRELSDDEIDAFYHWDPDCAVGMRSGRCFVIFNVTGAEPALAVAEGYRRWMEVAPGDASVDLVELMTAARAGVIPSGENTDRSVRPLS